MKFCVENDLGLFEFHDAEFSLAGFDGRALVVSASMINVHKGTVQNPFDQDMEIASAEIAFRNFGSVTYEPGRAWETGEDGKSYPVGQRVVFEGQDAMERILEELRNGITVYHFQEEENGRYSIGGCSGTEPYFEMGFACESIRISWEEYKRKAWYERHRKYRYDTVLDTPDGAETVKLTVSCHEEPVYYRGQPVTVIVGCAFGGKEYWGYGNDSLWIDAFADLQRKLPESVLLRCCLTCRYGNFSPAENDMNEVFCTRDITITRKSDLLFYAEEDAEREKRARPYCGLCEEYQPQTDEVYTCNDYLYFLNRKSEARFEEKI